MIKKLFLIICFSFAVRFSAASPYAFPVPFVEKQHPLGIFFKDLPVSGTIKIYTITGELVREISFSPGHSDPLPWNDVTTTSGKHLASGVYFYSVDGSNQQTTGKLVVIR